MSLKQTFEEFEQELLEKGRKLGLAIWARAAPNPALLDSDQACEKVGSKLLKEIFDTAYDLGACMSLQGALVECYEARLGVCPFELRARIKTTESRWLLWRWVRLFAAASAEEIRAEVLDGAESDPYP